MRQVQTKMFDTYYNQTSADSLYIRSFSTR